MQIYLYTHSIYIYIYVHMCVRMQFVLCFQLGSLACDRRSYASNGAFGASTLEVMLQADSVWFVSPFEREALGAS